MGSISAVFHNPIQPAAIYNAYVIASIAPNLNTPRTHPKDYKQQLANSWMWMNDSSTRNPGWLIHWFFCQAVESARPILTWFAEFHFAMSIACIIICYGGADHLTLLSWMAWRNQNNQAQPDYHKRSIDRSILWLFYIHLKNRELSISSRSLSKLLRSSGDAFEVIFNLGGGSQSCSRNFLYCKIWYLITEALESSKDARSNSQRRGSRNIQID
jgi:hypothetical protein